MSRAPSGSRASGTAGASPGSSARARWGGAAAWLGAGGLHALLMAAAFPPVELWGGALLAPVPLVWAADRLSRRPAGGGWRGRVGAPTLVGLGVLPLWLYEEQWVAAVSAIGYPLLCLALAGFAALFVGLGAHLLRRWPRWPAVLVVPMVWTALEVLRGEVVFTGYAWMLLAHPLIAIAPAGAVAAMLGTYAVSFAAAALASAPIDGWRGGRRARTAGVVAVAIPALAGLMVLAPRTTGGSRTVRVAVIQTNVPQDNKLAWSIQQRLRDFERFLELTRTAAAASPPPDLIVWPETMFPGMWLDAESVTRERAAGLSWAVPAGDGSGGAEEVPTTVFADRLVELQSDLGIPVVVGAITADGVRFDREAGEIGVHAEARYNSAVVIASGAIDPVRYDKLDLTPFGEVIPYVWRWPGLQRLVLAIGASGMAFDLSPGAGPRVLRVPTTRGEVLIATPICFEATRAGLCRRLVFDAGDWRADLLLNLTNDGWFGGFDAGRRQHLQIARWRCAELGTPMVRAANTGISCLIDASGRVVQAGVDGTPGASRREGVLTVDVVLAPGATIYGRTGDVFGWLVLGGSGAMLLAGPVARRWRGRARPAEGRG